MVILCIGATIYGRSPLTPNRLAALGLGRCADQPCLYDIVPGQTSWSDAKDTFASMWNSQIAEKMIVLPMESTGRTVLHRSVDGATVKEFYIIVPLELGLTAGDIVQQFGSPCRIGFSVYPATNVATLYYPWLYVSTNISADRLTVDGPVRHISYLDLAYRATPQHDPCRADFQADLSWQQTGNFSWQGFASLARYRK